jgi:hypothetical protein
LFPALSAYQLLKKGFDSLNDLLTIFYSGLPLNHRVVASPFEVALTGRQEFFNHGQP